MKKLQILILIQSIIVAVLLLGGCASSPSSQSFARTSTRVAFDVYYGEVVSSRTIEIEGEQSGLGLFGGGLIGYAIGRGDSPWYRNPRRLEASLGTVGGSIAGEAIQRTLTREDGLEIIVLLDHNETIAVVQAGDVGFSPGQRVQVLIGNNGDTRVQPL